MADRGCKKAMKGRNSCHARVTRFFNNQNVANNDVRQSINQSNDHHIASSFSLIQD